MVGDVRDAGQDERAVARVAERSGQRLAACAGLRDGTLLDVNDPDRAALRVDRVTRYRAGAGAVAPPAVATPADLVHAAAQRLGDRVPERLAATARPEAAVLLEAVVNQPDFLPARYLEDGVVAQRAVGRVVVRDDGHVSGYGTGFLVSPRLLLTNHHVLPDAAVAADALLELEYQEGTDGRPRAVTTVVLDPATLFVADAELDFALVAVEPVADLARFGWLPLTAAQGTVVVGEEVTIVQHPAGRPKEVVLRANELVDIAEQVLHYVADTEPGSSGSPVFNDQWEVVALHHASVTSPDPGSTYAVVNEGIRISRVLARLARADVDPAGRALLDQLGTAPARVAVPVGTPGPGPETAPGRVPDTVVEVPLRVTVSLGTATSPPATPPTPPGVLVTEAVDRDYTNRRGYDPDFLGLPLPLPGPGSHAADVLPPLAYHHFSVVLHRTRRLALVAAVNIDGTALAAPVRTRDRWILDPRLPADQQTGPDVYLDNALDRGHLVRRVDPAWGALAAAANDDTFHYTNSAPQHEDVNQGAALWLGLEDFVLGVVARDRLRVSVLSGPVLAPDDPPYRGVLLPRQFYKLVAVREPGGDLAVSAYVLSQADRLPGVLADEATFGGYGTFQVPVATVADLTGLDLGAYTPHDALAAPVGPGGRESVAVGHPLRTFGDTVLWRRSSPVP
ncbi:endonuclease [Cellulomonas triticagri]|uniref:Serine protease n=1 Tax=Cellulomonas triticagri TaxID=2483352 RepID=A0A3M2JKA4_9CELL|nr:endonuclease [Cellulomonas triticagri]